MIPGIRMTAGRGTAEAADEGTSGSWPVAIEGVGGMDARIIVTMM
jgi:hypothetical protein